jgi:hypothetical protein
MELYAFYESDEERQDMIALESAEISLDRALLAYKAIMESREINLREAELRCVMEGGDACTLMDFYEDAQEQTDDKQKGLLATIWDKITQFVDKIKKALGIGQKQDDAEYAVSSNTNKFIAGLKQAASAVKNFFATPVKAAINALKSVKNIFTGLVLGTVVIVGGKFVINKIKNAKGGNGEEQSSSGETVQKMKGSEINGHLKFLSSLCDQVKNGANSIKSKFGKNNNQDADVSGEGGGIVSFFTKKINECRNHLKNAPSFDELTKKASEGIDKAGKAVTELSGKAAKQAEKISKNVQKGGKAVKAAADTTAGAAKSVGNAIVGAVQGALSKFTGGAQEEGAEEYGMTKDFAELLASEEYTESADEEELAGMLADLI